MKYYLIYSCPWHSFVIPVRTKNGAEVMFVKFRIKLKILIGCGSSSRKISINIRFWKRTEPWKISGKRLLALLPAVHLVVICFHLAPYLVYIFCFVIDRKVEKLPQKRRKMVWWVHCEHLQCDIHILIKSFFHSRHSSRTSLLVMSIQISLFSRDNYRNGQNPL